MSKNISNFFNFQNKNSKIGDFQDLEHIDGVGISSVSAGLYEMKRDDVVLLFLEMVPIMPVFTLSQKLCLKNINGILKLKTEK